MTENRLVIPLKESNISPLSVLSLGNMFENT